MQDQSTANLQQQYATTGNVTRLVAARFRETQRLVAYRNDPVLWAKERLGMDLWSIQGKIAESVRDNKKTAVKSCHASGKTQLAAILVCWWVDTHPPEHTRVVTTAPTSNQVIGIMWEYIRVLHRKHGLRGDVSEAAEWKSEERDIIAQGRKPADTNIHGFNGVHRTFVLVILDEACGIPEQLWTGAEAITTTKECRILAIGNPDDHATAFGKLFKEATPGWNLMTITAFDTPNFTEERWELPVAVSKNLIDQDWVDDKKTSWGESSSRYRAKIMAEFPEEAVDTFFSPFALENGIDTYDTMAEMQAAARNVDGYEEPRPVIGADIARFGDDSTVVVINRAGALSILSSWDKTDTMATALKIHNLAIDTNASEVRVDATGIGVAVVDRLLQLCAHFYKVIEIVGSAASPDVTRWYNARAYLYDYFRENLMTGKLGIPTNKVKDSKEKRLHEELEGIRYKFLRGAILIESKDDMRKRHVKSPDYADAAMYAAAPIDVDDPNAGMRPGDVSIYDAVEAEDEWMARGYVCSPI